MADEKHLTRRGFLKILGTAGVAASVSFPFTNLKPAWAFGNHPQEKLPYTITKKVPQVCARACEAD